MLSAQPLLLQPKLAIGAPDDAYEREADRAAETVMRMPEPDCHAPLKYISRQESSTAMLDNVPSSVHETLALSGRPLDNGTRSFMEPRFGHDFSRVRIHADAKAAESAQSINARAYTAGNHLVFNRGQYAPDTSEGRRLLGHELTHTLQQGRGTQTLFTPIKVIKPSEEQESQAEHVTPSVLSISSATRSALSSVMPLITPSPALIAKKADPEAVAKMTPEDIMRHPDYIENNLEKMQFFSAEQATLHYSDGTSLTIGLVPQWIKPPLETVDYRSASEQYTPVKEISGGTTSNLKFIKDVMHLPAEGMTYGEVISTYAVSVQFSVDTQSGKIIPNHLNPVTAPYLCSVLKSAEAEYVKRMDEMAEGMIKVLEVMKLIVELEMFRVTLGGPKTPKAPRARAGGVGAGAAAGFSAAEKVIITEVRSMLSSAQMVELRAAFAAGRSVTVRIGSRVIQYEPGLNASGMTMFGENGFLLGNEAFVSEAELIKTLLHETYRLSTSAIGRGAAASGEMVAAETDAAFEFAERAFDAFF